MSSQNNPLARLARRSRIHIALAAILTVVAAPWTPASAASAVFPKGSNGLLSTRVQTRLQTLGARFLGAQPADTPMQIAVSLPLRNRAELAEMNRRLYNPADPLFGKYLTPQQFEERFGATQADYDAVVAFLRSRGLVVSNNATGRNLILASGSTAKIQAALAVKINKYKLPHGAEAYANAGEPIVPSEIASKIIGVIGLDNLATRHPHISRPNLLSPRIVPHVIGSGPFGGLTPTDIKTAYKITQGSLDGDGQTVGLLELDGYIHSDIKAYTDKYDLGDADLEDVLLNGFNGAPTSINTEEVVLDIEMIKAIAPKAKILVYEAANTAPNFVAILNEMARTGKARIISISWGNAENEMTLSEVQTEHDIFERMVNAGQAVYAASGDDGAFGDTNRGNPTLVVADDPAAQSNVVAVGGTTLKVTGKGGEYVSETTWNDIAVRAGSGGGGISQYWPKPDFQKGIGSTLDKRELPDVSLNSSPLTGYSYYATIPGGAGKFLVGGGTSFAAPLWAAFHALVNQQRVSLGSNELGFPNPQIYSIAGSNKYVDTFHDIKDSSTNGFYAATAGFDDATGWGTPIGDNLLNALAPALGGPPGKVAGSVTDEDGFPINVADAGGVKGGVTVSAFLGDNATPAATTTTSVTGAYLLSIPSGTSFILKADAEGYAGQITVNVSVPPNGTIAQDMTLKLAHHFENSGVQMISAPYDFTRTADFSSILTLTPNSVTKPPLIAWQASQNRYVQSPNAPADTFRLGQGYWVKLPAVGYLSKQGATAPTNQEFRIRLQKGWNQIGDPFLSDVAVTDLQVDKLIPDVPDAPVGIGTAGNTLVRPIFWSFDAAAYAQRKYPYVQNDLTATLHPWLGYWVFANNACVLIFPASDSGPPGPPPGPL
jgi:hypothetical protein